MEKESKEIYKLKEICKQGKDLYNRYIKDNIKDFGVLGGVLTGTGMIILNYFWYFYMLGKFNKFNINRVYINFQTQNIVYELINSLLIALLFIALGLWIRELKHNNRLIDIAMLYVMSYIIFSLILLTSPKILDGIEINLNSILEIAKITFFAYNIFCGLLIFFFAWPNLLNRKTSIIRKDESVKQKGSWLPAGLILFIFISAIIIYLGYDSASGQNVFKTVDREYVVLYEDKEIFILAKAEFEEVEGINYIVKINQSQQKIVNKLDIETVEMEKANKTYTQTSK